MIKDYEKIQLIGRGAFGKVYLYKKKSDEKSVVIKQIPSMTSDEFEASESEAKVFAMLKHPNIIEYHESFMESLTMHIVMEYAPGGNLNDYLQVQNKDKLFLQEEDVLHLFCQLLLGMQHIHDKNILHRDLKSHNVLLDRCHRLLKISDFGISKILSSKSKANTVVGTPCYMSPEVCQEKPYDQKSDVWAVGCILYEMLALQRPFQAETLPALINKIMRGVFGPLPSRYSDMMNEMVLLLLTMDPGYRPTINQIISYPLIFPALFRLHGDLGIIIINN